MRINRPYANTGFKNQVKLLKLELTHALGLSTKLKQSNLATALIFVLFFYNDTLSFQHQ